MNLDPNNPPYIEGEVTNIRVVQTEIPGGGSNLVIDPSREFTVELTWELRGFYAPLWVAGLAPSDWSVDVYAESMGPGPELLLKEDTEPRLNNTHVAGVFTWTHTMTVAPGTLPESNPGSAAGPSGLYKLVASVFLNSNLGFPGFDISGYIEGPVIRVENPI